MRIIGDIFAYGFFTVLLILGLLGISIYFLAGDFSFNFFFYLLLYHFGGLSIAVRLKKEREFKIMAEETRKLREKLEKYCEERGLRP